MCTEAVILWKWCIKRHAALSAAYLPGAQRSPGDYLTRHFSTNLEWEIYDSVLNDVFRQWRITAWELFASQVNRKLPQYCSRAAPGKDSLGDVLLMLWKCCLGYIFPSNSFDTTGFREDPPRQSLSHPHCAQLAETFLVHRSVEVLCDHP